MMILVIGEILFDLFPDDKRMGGAPFNFAFHLKKLGFDVCFFSRVGKDDLGCEILNFIGENGFDPRNIQVDPAKATGTVDIEMDFSGGHCFSIVKDRAWDHLEWDQRISDCCAKKPEMVYFGSLVQRTSKGEDLINRVLNETGPETQRFCDINLRPSSYTQRILDQSIAGSDILKLSHEELDTLVPGPENMLEQRAASLLSPQGPHLIILTRGEKGSIWIKDRDVTKYPGPEPGKLQILDTVGAGDAYAAMSAAGILKGLPPQKTMALAQEFAEDICGIKGALPKNHTLYQGFLKALA